MVPKERIELPTYRLQGGCTTALLLGRIVADGDLLTLPAAQRQRLLRGLQRVTKGTEKRGRFGS